ncbi:MAG: sigma-70 family RNA polymerase sigma factor [Saprospiraceae bacterium]|nr:sigma-70 family RNA polymerase sigma factor [Saprospiraceae bacterium]
MIEPTDIQLLQGAQRGDARCEEALYRRFNVPMFRVCLRYAANRQEAEDMLQEGFLRVFADLSGYRGEGSLEGWVRRVIVRSALRWLRQRRAFGTFEDLDDTLTVEPDEPPALFPNDDHRLVTQLLQQLPPGYRTVLNLFALEGYSHEEIAGLLGINIGTSRSQLSKARAMLKQLLSQRKLEMRDER